MNVRRQRDKARHLWRASKPPLGTPVETYLSACCAMALPFPSTVRFLPPRKPDHHAAMIVPYGRLPEELEPGALVITEPAIVAVQLTLLKPTAAARLRSSPTRSQSPRPPAGRWRWRR
jgi:hypothetical protein